MSSIRATYYKTSDKEGETATTDVAKICSMGILIDDSAADETLERLIPWHRVFEVWSRSEGVLYMEAADK